MLVFGRLGIEQMKNGGARRGCTRKSSDDSTVSRFCRRQAGREQMRFGFRFTYSVPTVQFPRFNLAFRGFSFPVWSSRTKRKCSRRFQINNFDSFDSMSFFRSNILRAAAATAKSAGAKKPNPFYDPAAIPVVAACVFACGMAVFATYRTLANHNDLLINKKKPFEFRQHGQPKGFFLQSGRVSADQSQWELKYDDATKMWVNPNKANTQH